MQLGLMRPLRGHGRATVSGQVRGRFADSQKTISEVFARLQRVRFGEPREGFDPLTGRQAAGGLSAAESSLVVTQTRRVRSAA